MQRRFPGFATLPGATAPAGAGPGGTLVVQGPSGPPAAVRLPGRPAAEVAVHTTLAALDAGLMARILPERVVTPLLGEGFDALDVAERLAALGFRGRLEIAGPALPDRRLIRAEIAAVCPGVEVRFADDPGDDAGDGPGGAAGP